MDFMRASSEGRCEAGERGESSWVSLWERASSAVGADGLGGFAGF